MRQPSFLDQLLAAASSQGARSLRAQKAADVIRRSRAYRWVGIYELDREDLALVAWSGFGDHPEALPAPAEGLYSEALRTGRVGVAKSRSKIVVPIVGGGAVMGIIDVESDQTPALGGGDRAVLEGCASVLATLWPGGKAAEAVSPDR
jgi:putative methionine-R-sulfoxide reductase with GAF domain